MKTRFIAVAVMGAALLMASGCQTVGSRIKDKPEIFAKLDPAAQANIKQGKIEIGYTEDMVYLALGAPDRKRETISAHGRSVTWIYDTYGDYYDDSHFLGVYGGLFRGPYMNAYHNFYWQTYPDAAFTERTERMRVVFKDGKAAVIEKAES
jgi:hypothetical protein